MAVAETALVEPAAAVAGCVMVLPSSCTAKRRKADGTKPVPPVGGPTFVSATSDQAK